MTVLAGKRILLVVSGGIAAYKTLELIRRLRERRASVRCVLTAGGAQFVTPLSLAALSEQKVHSELFSLTQESEMGHIRLSREADLVVVAPASADLLAKMAAGLADDLASTALLATDKPVLVAPSMNVRMWQHAATRANLQTLAERGVLRVGPGVGDMACGEFGPGRMAEPAEIVGAIEAVFGGNAPPVIEVASAAENRPLIGRRALVTSGPTREAIVFSHPGHGQALVPGERHARRPLSHGHPVHLAGRERAPGDGGHDQGRAAHQAHYGCLGRTQNVGHRLGRRRQQPLQGVGAGSLARDLQPMQGGFKVRQAIAQDRAVLLHPVARKGAPHAQDQLLQVQRFRQVVTGVQAQGLQHPVLVRVGREHDHAK